MRYGAKWPEYAKQWDRMAIKANRRAEFLRAAQGIVNDKEIYQRIENGTAYDLIGRPGHGVPWAMIGILHLRESDRDFSTYLGNGQRLNRRTTIVPIGRGPFLPPDAFYKGAIDALNVDGLSSIFDWRLEKALYYFEIFNGAGYHNRGLPSPYVWGGTNIQRPGK